MLPEGQEAHWEVGIFPMLSLGQGDISRGGLGRRTNSFYLREIESRSQLRSGIQITNFQVRKTRNHVL